MSQPTNSTAQEVIITDFVRNIRAPFTFVTVVTSLCACLIPLLVVLFVFSTAESRRRLIFRLNVIAICFALVLGVLNFVVSGSAILRPLDPIPASVYTATIIFAMFPPIFYDSILLTRLLALYPIERTPLSTLMRVLAFPVCVKCGRFVVLSLYVHQYIISTPDVTTLTTQAEVTWFRNPYVTTEWTLQMFDNLYSSGLFLYKLHIQCAGTTSLRLTLDSFTFSLPQTIGIGRRIRQILYISAANFVFPVLFNIGQIICITTDSSFYVGTVLLLANSYVSVIGVLCATIWVSGDDYIHRRHPYSTGSSFVSPRRSMGGNGPRPDIEQGTGVRFETSINRNNTVELSKADKDLQDLRHGVGDMSDKRELSTGSSTSIMFPIVEEHVRYDTEQR
ncbi:hypothetical protein F5J12DRAFT_445898 [Pisolithus orientalis]|uniref:uncharacterized protein n=1 Tax=Pisolithus orientalis TaxID=936130 RepID=UPI002225B505|nr:uncharacterized protein F5J12DRAFT_445898 [Pisolithus orientalis]KAI6025727.1 hypothetical protein F5J12DRAFT_445898 [Pisolithus orientalis]